MKAQLEKSSLVANGKLLTIKSQSLSEMSEMSDNDENPGSTIAGGRALIERSDQKAVQLRGFALKRFLLIFSD